MLVPIKNPDSDSVPTWAMIELQGEIERTDGGSLEQSFDVGTLSTSSSGAVLLHIGYHQLEGKRMELKKPFAVLDKVSGSSAERQTGYKVIGVVRERYLFKARPRALISKPGQKK